MQLAMSGNRKVALVAVVALLVCHSFVFGDYETAGSRSNNLLVPTKKDNVNVSFRTVSQTIDGITRESYRKFIKDMRNLLVGSDPKDTVHRVPRLRNPSTVNGPEERFIYVELVNSQKASVTLKIDVTNVYVVGYWIGSDQFYYCKDKTAGTSRNFAKVKYIELPFSCSNYSDLEGHAGKKREEILLGITELDNSIEHLRYYDGPANVARSLIVVIQMLSEAIRFRYIEYQVAVSIGNDGSVHNFYPSRSLISLENNWITLSTRIQRSIGGVLDPAVKLVGREDEPVSVDSVNKYLINNIAVILFVCNNCPNIREPTIRISGRNGLCVDVKDGFFNDGDPLILWTCKSNEDANQLWTLKTNGTIRSNGKCMTSNGIKAGQYVMIYNCATAVPIATKWQVWDNGTIINPKSGLVLTAGLSGSSGTKLTVANNIYNSRQGWLLSNNTTPIVTPIIGFKDRCLQANYGNTVWIEECVSNKITQQWAIYPDGTIRPNGNKEHCLTWESYPNQGEKIVVIQPCDGGAAQRWQFNIDGTISNLNTGLVMDVKWSDLSLRKILAWTFNGNPNQMWQAWLL